MTFKDNINDYLDQLPKTTLLRLYKDPSACLSVFRLLPGLAKQFVLSLLYYPEPLSLEKFDQLVNENSRSKQAEALDKLYKLHIFQKKEDYLYFTDNFKEQFQILLVGGNNYDTFGILCLTPDKKNIDIAFLDNYARKKWETILHFMLGIGIEKLPGDHILSLLHYSQLMSGTKYDNMKITNSGFQFLLQDINSQIWTLLLQYLNMTEDSKIDPVDVLQFLFMLGNLELGKSYLISSLTPIQINTLENLKDYGIVYRRKSSRRFYPTRLATILTSNTEAFSSNSDIKNILHPNHNLESADKGFIILETNYRLYAYTDSPIQIAVLNLFVHLQLRFSNLVTGIVTRNSVRQAFMNGITAEQIISYLTTYAHPQMRKNTPIIPPTITDQIQLWEMERNRLKATEGYLFRDFNSNADFELALKYANELNIVVWEAPLKGVFFVNIQGSNMIVDYIKKKFSK
ncbi:hypothetical protein T552_00523 [Pneumocystis carinii B80]|uniref:RNA polymerase II transcription factor B subunit 2 n=1 Tax=Pneumocystis carinii (strain B80) TaxID=1408658 RepID=A0A0W4ZR20_PNEC8|nr:hypothetical protein T552_00523 [Pneumocystis carinii B80]KTW30811.1 hypothetical protein T552_00523 [Pneumocystis carinii B80]